MTTVRVVLTALGLLLGAALLIPTPHPPVTSACDQPPR